MAVGIVEFIGILKVRVNGINFSIRNVRTYDSYSDWTRNYSEKIHLPKIVSNMKYTSNYHEEVPNLNHSDHDPNDNWWSYLNLDPAAEETCIDNYHEEQPNAVTNTTTNSNGSSNVSSMDKLSLSMGLGGPLGEVFQSSKKCCGSNEVSPQDSPSRINYLPSGVIHKALYSDSSSCSYR